MSSEKNFIPYQVVLDINREDDSYCLFEALNHYGRYLSAQERLNQPELRSIHRLIDMIDTAWMNTANTTARG
ncbi:hypothetical protein [Glutamicibacter sp. NPDC090743]|uniref:hypothetical protein n=1 Tax=Glutamicibacter sp. NPDC090743 TaxID=3364001 RepID=UPI00380E6083